MASHLPSRKATTYSCSVTFKAHHQQVTDAANQTIKGSRFQKRFRWDRPSRAMSSLLGFLLRTFKALFQVGAPWNSSHLLNLLDTSSPRNASPDHQAISPFVLPFSFRSGCFSRASITPLRFELARGHHQRPSGSGSRAQELERSMGRRVPFSPTHVELTAIQ